MNTKNFEEIKKAFEKDDKDSKKKQKKKEKKRRQKAKKKEQENDNDNIKKNEDSSQESDEELSSDVNPDDLIANSAFAAANKKAGKLIEVKPTISSTPIIKNILTESNVENVEDSATYGYAIDKEESIRKAKEGASYTRKAILYAEDGKPIAAKEMFHEALVSFNKSIGLYPFDCRYYANRSLVYTKLGEFELAIRDADTSLSLNEDFPKGHYRKGQALIGLKKYDEAERCFMKILESDPNLEEAHEEIRGLKVFRLKDMGFSEDVVISALKKFDGVFEDALQELLSQSQNARESEIPLPENFHLSQTATVSKNLSVLSAPAKMTPATTENTIVEIIPTSASTLVVNPTVPHLEPHEDPRNPLQSKSIWIGNLFDVNDKVEKELKSQFSRFGGILNITIKKESRCAFVNYLDHKAAGEAMKIMQGQKIGNNCLLIRFPTNNNAATTINKPNLVLSKGSVLVGPPKANPGKNVPTRAIIENRNPDRLGTVECRHWRLGHCPFENTCWYKHILEHKGVDIE
ncbi:hypothetical protein QYM36_011387 [Artemia franciscana]|uniref:Uncharacterized protein n=2 Tax=Artemia franciscana TaxID=6661 RepID=A0AA88HV43_ARTSF|nr:hypothetical protein QYM36_011387 [Artemia franciscana]KAK2712682.1 hypothetical protein QYM36_011387 [Artemia franciscana]